MKVSICMATYNGSRYVKQQVESILSQLSDKDELIIADDGSNDETLSILRGYGQKLRILNHTRIGGVVPNFERVLTSAKGDIIVLADQDDILLPGRLDRIRIELKTNDLILLNAIMVDESLNKLNSTLFEVIGIRKGLFTNIYKNGFVGCCMAFRREILQIALPFPSNLPWHDWYLGLIGEMFFRVKRVEVPYLLFRRHNHNSSNTGSKSSNNLYKQIAIRIWISYALIIATARRILIISRLTKDNV